MATRIELQWVTAVLLGDGWHIIQPGTFRVDDYEVVDGDQVARAERGFHFIKQDQLTRETQHYAGPIGTVLAFRYSVPTEVLDVLPPD